MSGGASSISERACTTAEEHQAEVGAAEDPARCAAPPLAHRGGDLWASTGCNDEGESRQSLDPDVEEAIARENASNNKHIVSRWRDCSLSPLLPSRSDSSLAHSSAPTRRSSSSSLCSSPRSFAGSMSKKSVRWCLLGMPARERLPRVPWGKLDQPRSLLRSRSSDELRLCYLRRLGITSPDGPLPEAPLPEAPPITPMSVSAPQATSMTFLGGWCM